jgi:hypothetical protein
VRGEKASSRILFFATVLVSLAALATSWAGYQATLWSGDQAQQSNRASTMRTQSTQAATRAGLSRTVDVGMFTSWLGAQAARDTVFKRYLEKRFRTEFAIAFQAWIKDDPNRPGARLTPFEMAEYHVAADSQSRELAMAADRAAALSNTANRFGDAYVLEAVIFAMVIFFGTAAQQTHQRLARDTLVTVATLIFITGCYVLVSLPRGT